MLCSQLSFYSSCLNPLTHRDTETELAAAREAASASKAALITCEGQLGQAEAEKKNLTESIRKLKEDMLQLQQDLDTERGWSARPRWVLFHSINHRLVPS